MVRGRAVIDTLRKNLVPWLKFDPEGMVPNPGLVLLFILLVALVLRLVGVATMSAIDLDGTIYAQSGEFFSKGEFREALKGLFPPFYPLLIGIAHLVIPDLEVAGTAVSLVAGLLLVYLSFVFLRTIVGDMKALYAAFFVAINPYLVKYSASVLSESTASLLVLITVFAFWRAWNGESPVWAAVSGFALSLTYLTRPEYIAYSVPLCGLLLVKKQFLRAFLFALFFAFLTLGYMYLMKSLSGLLTVSKKAIMAVNADAGGTDYRSYLLPMLSLVTVIRHVPTVLYDAANAFLPHFLILALLGIKRMNRRYAVLVGLLFLFHLLPPSAMGASSKRFYVELVPLMLAFAVAGLSIFRGFMDRFRPGRTIYYLCIIGIIVLSVVQCVNPRSTARELHKQAGLYLLSRDPGHIVASTLPLVPFYSHGEWRYLPYLARGTDTCKAFMDQMKKEGVGYAATDEDTEKIAPFVAGCLKPLPTVGEFTNGNEFVRLYRIGGT